MKRLIRSLGVVLLCTGALSAHGETLTIATEGVYPPFSYMENGELKGFDVDIGKALCAQMKATCTFVAQDFDGLIPGLLAKKYDLIIASMSITAERKKKIDFTDKYWSTPQSFLALKSSHITQTTPAALKGKIIGTQGSTTLSAYLEDTYKDSQIKPYRTIDDANLDLLAERVDVVFSDKVQLVQWIKDHAEGSSTELVGEDIRDEQHFGLGKGIATPKDRPQLTARLNTALAAILANGSYQQINARYFPFSIY